MTLNSNLFVMTFPLRGEWVTIATPGHHRFAFDIVAVPPNSNRYFSSPWLRMILRSAPVSVSYSWFQPVYSPVAGIVLKVSDGWLERLTLNLARDLLNAFVFRPSLIKNDIRPFAGNYALIESEGVVVLLAHLRDRSLRISSGEMVQKGQFIAEIGNSGNSIMPHLHIQVMDGFDPLKANIVPFGITGCEVWNRSFWQPMNGELLEKSKHIHSN